VTRVPKLKRPKSDGKCIHCREVLVESTKDHVFPASWYPNSTPPNVQRWTIPSCKRCNGQFGELERELFIRLALCINPLKPAASGLVERALRSLGIRARGLTEEERLYREALKAKILRELKPYTSDIQKHVLPGMGPHPEGPAEQQFQISISGEDLHAVLRKIVRGCEYWFLNGRIIEPPWEISIHFVQSADVPDSVRKIIAPFGPVYLGPGIQIQRAGSQDGSNAAFYRIVFWDSLFYFSAILPPEESGT
jgi:hypothetical protein